MLENAGPLIDLLKSITLIGLTTGLASFAYSSVIKTIKKKAWFQEYRALSTLLDSMAKPIQLSIGLNGLFFALETIATSLHFGAFATFFGNARCVSWIVILTYGFLQWKRELETLFRHEKEIEGKSSMEKATVDAVGKLISFAILLLATLTSLQVLGMPIQSFLAFGAVGAAGLAWASTDIVKNFFGGFMIHVMRPFAVGDWINSPEKDIEGVVEEIGWYQTQIRTFDRRPIYVPNGLFPAIVLRNPSRMSNRRIFADIGIRYTDVKRVGAIVDDIETMLKKHPAIDTRRTLMVHFVAFGSYSLNINVYCFTKTTDWAEWRKKQQDVFLKIAEIVEGHGAEIAFPTQTLQMSREWASFEKDMAREEAVPEQGLEPAFS